MYLFARLYWCIATHNPSILSAVKWSCGGAKQKDKECLGKIIVCTSGGANETEIFDGETFETILVFFQFETNLILLLNNKRKDRQGRKFSFA